MDTQTQIERLIELAIVQRTELKELVAQLPQLRQHLNTEVEKAFEEAEPQLRSELEEWTTKQAQDKTAALGVALETKIAELAKNLEISTQARYNAIIAEREENARLAAQAEQKIAEHAASLPGAVKEIVTAELARFPRAGEIDQLRKEFAEPRGLNPRGKWQAGEVYNKLDLVTVNGDSYTSNLDGNRTRPTRSSADWTLVAARGTGGGGGPTSLSELTTVPSNGDLLIGSGTSWVTSNLTAGAGISITVGAGEITISATDGDITLDDGTAASPSLHFTNDPDTGLYRPAANTLGISVSGTQVAYFDANGLTVPSAGVVAGGSIHAANGNANNPSLSFSDDQDTGFFRHQPNELGITLGGTQYATLTSTTFSITPNITVAGTATITGAITGSSLTGPATTNLTLAGGSSGASLVLGQGSAGQITGTSGTITTGTHAASYASTFTPLASTQYAFRLQPTVNSGAAGGGTVQGLNVSITSAGTSNVADIEGLRVAINRTGSSGIQTNSSSFVSAPAQLAAGTTSNLYHFKANNGFTSAGSFSSQYAFYAEAMTGGTVNNYAFYSAGAGKVYLGDSTASTSTTTGALVVSGGVGVAGAANVGGNLTVSGTGNNILNSGGGNLLLGTVIDGGQKLQVAGTAGFTGAISIGNTVNTVSPTSPNRTITMVIGGTTYYIAAKTTND